MKGTERHEDEAAPIGRRPGCALVTNTVQPGRAHPQPLRTLTTPVQGSSRVLRQPSASRRVTLAARTHHRRGLVLVALGLFQLWLWGTRIVNLLGESESFSTAFVAVHLVLYIAAIGAGLLLLGLGAVQLREVRATQDVDADTGDGAGATPTAGTRP